jgi:hypothetical protein
MDKSVIGLLGAISAFAVASPSYAISAATVDLDDVMHADSYADLLKPVPNAVAVRQALDERRSAQPPVPEIMTVQYYHHHHHHHHHHYYRPRHHHHHHHRGVRIGPVVIR